MNGDNIFKWVKEKLIPHLPPKSVLIIDNAPYHNLQVDKCPTQASRKADIQAWLTRQQIPFGATLLKTELLQICKQHKPDPSFLLDNMLKEYGHDCLRLPAYHADLNSIELIWATMKGYIARRNVTFKMTDVLQLTNDAIAAVIGRFQAIKTDVLLIFSFITGDETEFLSPMMFSNEYITGI